MTRLQVYDREYSKPAVRTKSRRDLSIGTVAPRQLSGLGQQLNRLGEEIKQKVKAAEHTVEYAGIISDAKKRMNKYYSARSRMTDEYGTLVQDTDAFFQGIEKEITKGIKDPQQQAHVINGMRSISQAFNKQAITDSTAQAIDSIKGDQVRSRAAMIQEAALGDDEYMSSVMVNYSNMMRSLSEAGVYDIEDVEKDILSFADDSVRGRVRYLMNTDPYSAQAYLTDQRTFSKLLKPEHRENLLAQTDRLIRQQEEREERERNRLETKREKAEKDMRDATFQTSILEIRQGNMSISKLDRRMEAGMYNKSDYQTLYKVWLNRSKDFIGSPEIFQSMLDRAYMAELDRREIMVALSEESINNDMADKLIDEVEKGAMITRTEEYKTYLSSLRTKLGYTPAGNLDSAHMQLIGNATIEFRRRAIEGENIQSIFDDLSVRFSKSFREAVEKPRFKTPAEAKAALGPGKALDRELMLQRVHQERLDFNAGAQDE